MDAYVDAPDTCTPGETVTAGLYVTFVNGTRTNRYAVRMLGDLYVGGSRDQSFDECVVDTMTPGSTTVRLATVSWTCGESLEFRIVTVSWSANAETCADTPSCAERKAKCWSAPVIAIEGLPLSVDYSSTAPVCDGEAVGFSDLTTGGSGSYSYSWDFGDGDTSTSASPSHLYDAPGTYTVTLLATSSGVSNSATGTVTVYDNPTASASNGGPYCPSETIELSAAGGTSYSWSGPNGFTSSLQNPTIANVSSLHAGTYTVTVTGTGGCSDQASTTVDIDTTPPILTTPPDVTIECGDATDPAQMGQASATDTDDPTPTVTYSDLVNLSGCGNTGTITRTWTATDDCGNTDTGIQTITIVDTTAPAFSEPAGVLDGTIECDASTDPANTGTPTAIDACDSAPTVTYSDDVNLSGCGGNTGTITRTWTATDDCGNAANYIQVISVVDTTPPSLSISNATFECDGAGNINDIANWIASASSSDTCGPVAITNNYAGLTEECPGTGTTAVTFVATDPCGNATERTATVTVVDTIAPDAVDDTATTDENVAVLVNVLQNDSDICDDAPSLRSAGSPTFGTAVVVGNQVQYTPPAGFDGTATFSYTIEECSGNSDTALVEITVLPVNDPPTANDQIATAEEDTPLAIIVLGTDPDEDPLTFTILSEPTNGTISGFNPATGALIYTPDADYNGPDSFTFEACDPDGLCDTATVTITVEPVDDPSTADPQSLITSEDTPLPITVTGSDIDGEPVTHNIVSGPSHGTISGFDTVTGELIYTPDENFTGTDSFVFEACDPHPGHGCAQALVTISVTPVNDPPIANDDATSTPEDTSKVISVWANDLDIDGNLDPTTVSITSPPASGSVSLDTATGDVTYTPDANYNGIDAFSYQICDTDGQCDTATVSVNVSAEGDPPVANNDSAITPEDQSVQIDVLDNDSDVDNDLDPASVTISVPPANGSVSVDPTTGEVTYAPNEDFHGQDVFTYQVCDSEGICDEAAVSIAVLPVDDPPVANDQSVTAEEDTPLGITVTATDPDGDALNYTILSGPTHGTISAFDPAAGELVYTPDEDYHGIDSFTFTACDPDGLCDTATVSIIVEPVDDPPIANPQDLITPEDTPLSITVAGSDADNDPLTYNILSGPSNGTISGFDPATGELLYTPDANFTGTDSFVFEACDPHPEHGCAQAVIMIAVTPVNDPPVAQDDKHTTGEDTPTGFFDLLVSDPDNALSELTFSIIDPPVHGTVVLGTDHDANYTPNANFNGEDTFTYQVCDLDGLCDTATVTVDVLPVDDPPVAVDDAVEVAEDGSVDINVPANDSDPDGNLDLGSVSIINQPTNGTVVVDPISGVVTYEPDENFNGTDTFIYEICDRGGVCDTAKVTVEVNPVDDPPVAADDTSTVPEDGSITINVPGNDSDPDGDLDLTSVSIVSQPPNGTVNINPITGEISYEPDENFNGTDTFSYQICDSLNVCDTAAVTVNVTPVDDPPVANDDSTVTPEDTSVIVGVVDNDFDVDGNLDPTTVEIVSSPSNGTVSVDQGSGDVTYTPEADFNGIDTFSYQVCDTDGLCDAASVTVNVGPEDDPPVALNDTGQVLEDGVTTINVVSNDSDPDGNLDPTSVVVTSPPAHGTFSVNPVTGAISYEPNDDYNGPDTLVYQICDTDGACDLATVTINVLPVDDPPVANNDTVSMPEDGSVTINVSGNDSDPDGDLDVASVSVLTQPSHGTVVVDPITGAITYEPYVNYNGRDTFTYQICDSEGVCDTATVTVNVAPVDDLPVATPQTLATPEDTALLIELIGSDADGDPLTYNILVGPRHGVISGFDPVTGELLYTPNENYNGPDSFTFEVCDPHPNECGTATVTINVTPVPDSPVANNDTSTLPEDGLVTINVPGNDSDADGDLDLTSVTIVSQPANGTVSVNPITGVITYKPDLNYNGQDTFTYQICDSVNECDTATVTVNVLPVDDPPVARDDAVEVGEDGSVAINVPANDSDPDGNLDLTSVAVVSGPSHGAVIVDPITGIVTYEPDENFYGTDTFTYRICDSDGVCDTATVTVEVNPVDDPPVAGDDRSTVPEDGSVTINVPDNDSDPDGNLDITSVSIVSQPPNGTVTVDPVTGAITYEPNENFNGTDTFSYQICDSDGVCDVASVTVNVTPVDDPPVANDDSTTTPEDTSVIVGVVDNDFDVDGNLDPTTVEIVSSPSNGTVSVNPLTGEVTYTPEVDFNGIDTFSYQVCDSDGLCDVADVTVNVGPEDDPPVALDDTGQVLEDGVTTINVVSNDSDPDGNLDPTSVVVTSPPAHGTFSVNPVTGAISYEPNDDYNGPDTLVYQICDADGACDLATVTINVLPVDDPPVALDDTSSVAEDSSVVIPVLGNDSDPDGDLDPTSVTVLTPPSNGTVTVDPVTGAISYEPDENFNGQDTFAYQVCDAAGLCDTATVTVNVAPVDDLPVAVPQDLVTPEDKALSIGLIGSDADGDPLTYNILVGPAHGVISGFDAVTGELIYTPNENYNGPDSFTFEVCDPHPNECGTATVTIEVTPVPDPPVAENDSVTLSEDGSVTINVPANDSDLDGDLDFGSVRIIDQPANGTVTIDPVTGEIAYEPHEDFNGTDTFTYEICDSQDVCDTAIVTVDVLPIDDPPIAENDVSTTNEDTPVVIPVTGNDVDVDGEIDVTTVVVVDPPSHGSVSVDPVTGAVTYSPIENFDGQDTFVYQVCNTEGLCDLAEVEIDVLPENDPPQAACLETVVVDGTVIRIELQSSDADGDPLSYRIVEAPERGTIGGFDGENGSFYYSTLACAEVEVNLFVGDDAPAGSVGVPQGESLELSIRGGTTALADILVPPANGTAVVDQLAGVVRYTPLPGYSGPDAFTYLACPPGEEGFSGLVTIVYEVTDPVGATDQCVVQLQVVSAGGGGLGECETHVVISEIAWSGTSASESHEWIELRNLDDQPVDLEGWLLRWSLRDPENDRERLSKTIPLSGVIAPYQEDAALILEPALSSPGWWISWPDDVRDDFYLLERATDDVLPGIPADLIYQDRVQIELYSELDDRGEILELIDPTGCIADTANIDRLEEREGWAAGDATAWETMERTDAFEEDIDENWHTNLGLVRSGLDAFANLMHGTPGKTNSPILPGYALRAGLPATSLPMGEPILIDLNANPMWPDEPALWMVTATQEGILDPHQTTWQIEEAADGRLQVIVQTNTLPVDAPLEMWIRTPTGDVLLVPLQLRPV